MSTIKYNKLVRDRIPEIVEKDGNTPVFETLGSDEYKKYLDMKLGEELQEYLKDDSVDELADMAEVVYAILKYKGVDIKDFEAIRVKKALERGAFDKRILLREVIKK